MDIECRLFLAAVILLTHPSSRLPVVIDIDVIELEAEFLQVGEGARGHRAPVSSINLNGHLRDDLLVDGNVFVEHFLKVVLADGSDLLFDDLATLKEQDGGNSTNAIARSSLLV
jgi:hypothetical protein